MFNWIKKIRNSFLRWAARKGYTTIAKLLIKLGAGVNATDKYGNTALHYAATNGRKEIVKMLSCKALFTAAGYNNMEVVELFSDSRIDAGCVEEDFQNATKSQLNKASAESVSTNPQHTV